MPTTTFIRRTAGGASSEGSDRADGQAAVPDINSLLSALTAKGFTVAEPVDCTRTPLDSFDGRLHQAGLALELRRQVNSSTSGELVLTAESSITAVPMDEPPRFVLDLPPGPFRERLRPILEMRALVPTIGPLSSTPASRSFTDRVTTAVRRDTSDKAVVVVTVHDPVAPINGTVIPTVIEVSEVAGHPKEARRVHRRLNRHGYVAIEDDLASMITSQLGVTVGGYNSSPTVPLDPEMSAIDGFCAVFDNLAGTMEANWQGTVDDIDTEFLHDLRVALRRTRSVLGQAKGVVPEDIRQRYRTQFAWLAGVTSRTRDLDVYILDWDRYVGHLAADRSEPLEPVLFHLQQHRARAFDELVRHLTSSRSRSLIESWTEELRRSFGTEHSERAQRPVWDVVARRISSAHHTLIADGRKITKHSPSEALHDLRKDAKKLRYAVECFAGMAPEKLSKAFVRQLKGLQDNLGEHQDAEVHSAELRSVAGELSRLHTTPDTLVALGQLTERLEIEQRCARAEFGRRFSGFDSVETRRTLDRMLKGMRS